MKILRYILLVLALLLGLLTFLVYKLTPDLSALKDGTLSLQRSDDSPSVLVGPKHPNWVPLSKVSRFFINAIIVSEDSRFYQHYGLDYREIWNSFQTNLEQGRYARGASTITQQLVRIAFLHREKTILRKVREALGALLLERTLTKDEILEWYVNLIPLGQEQYGILEASHFYFKSDPELLSVSQSIQLAMTVPAPSVWAPGLIRKKLSEAGQKRFSKIAYALYSEGYITLNQYRKSLALGNFGAPVDN